MYTQSQKGLSMVLLTSLLLQSCNGLNAGLAAPQFKASSDSEIAHETATTQQSRTSSRPQPSHALLSDRRHQHAADSPQALPETKRPTTSAKLQQRKNTTSGEVQHLAASTKPRISPTFTSSQGQRVTFRRAESGQDQAIVQDFAGKRTLPVKFAPGYSMERLRSLDKSYQKQRIHVLGDNVYVGEQGLRGGMMNDDIQQSIDKITKDIQQGAEQAQKAIGKNVVVVWGGTRAGKSTFINYLAGCMMFQEDGQIRAANPLTDIGHGGRSSTYIPQIVPARNGLTYCDCPGLADSRGDDFSIINAVNIRQVLAAARSVRVVLLTEYNSLITPGAHQLMLRPVLESFIGFFGGAQNLLDRINSIHLGVTHIAQNGLSAENLRTRMRDASEHFRDPSVVRALAERLFIFDPLDRSLPGGWTRDQCVTAIKGLECIENPRDIFLPPLSSTDIDRVRQISEEIESRVQGYLKEGELEHTREQLSHLERLGVIGHPRVEEILQRASEQINELQLRQADRIAREKRKKADTAGWWSGFNTTMAGGSGVVAVTATAVAATATAAATASLAAATAFVTVPTALVFSIYAGIRWRERHLAGNEAQEAEQKAQEAEQKAKKAV